jgi:hypothetical protein
MSTCFKFARIKVAAVVPTTIRGDGRRDDGRYLAPEGWR